MALAFSGRFGTDDVIFGTDLRGYSVDAATGALAPGAVLGAAQGLPVSGITALEGFEMDGKAWALLGAAGSSSLTLAEVDADGGLRFETQLQDTAMTRFGGLSALEVVEAEGHLLVLVAGNDGGLSLFTLTPGGELIHLESLEHMPGWTAAAQMTCWRAARTGSWAARELMNLSLRPATAATLLRISPRAAT